MKRITISCMVAALLLAVTPPAFAKVQQGVTTTITALCNLPDILVTIPATAEIFINPYRLPVTIEASETDAQIISTPAAIENGSEVPLSVAVTLDCTVNRDSDIRLVTSSTQEVNVSAKFVFIYFEIQAVSDPDHVTWDSEFDAEKHIIVRDGESRLRQNMATIAQADQPDHFGAFRLTGDCIQNPRDPWSESDQMDVAISFTFTPLPRPGA